MSDYGGAIASNPRVALVDLTIQGSDFLWFVFATMTVSALGMIVWGHSLAPGRRAFHFTAAALLSTAAVAYFCMASDLGGTPIVVEFVRNTPRLYTGDVRPVTRSIWYVRYVDWFITTPLLLLTVLLGTGMPLSDIFFTIFMDEVMIAGGLIGALVASSYKWGLFTIATVAMFYVFFSLVQQGRKSAYKLSPEAGKAYTGSAVILSFLWLFYPLVWGLSDGGNVASTDAEMVAYGVLDLLAKPVFTFWHLYQLRKVPYESFRLQSGHTSIGATNGGIVGDAFLSEKQGLMNGNGHSNGNAYPPSGNHVPAPAPVTPSHGPTSSAPTSAPPTFDTHHDGTQHPNVAQHFQHAEGTQTTPGAGVVQHTVA